MGLPPRRPEHIRALFLHACRSRRETGPFWRGRTDRCVGYALAFGRGYAARKLTAGGADVSCPLFVTRSAILTHKGVSVARLALSAQCALRAACDVEAGCVQ